MAKQPLDRATRDALAKNLFRASHSAVEPWHTFPWHRNQKGDFYTVQPNSSQALAIDVFGTLKTHANRDAIVAGIAERIGVPSDDPWQLHLEWEDRENRLREKARTQVDVVAFGSKSVIFFECKFTEQDGGSCSQPRRLGGNGPNSGETQCNGRYVDQINPVNGRSNRCALSGKEIRYWDAIPNVFKYEADCDHAPCPFAGPWFQWMRNLVLCHEVASAQQLEAAFVVVYADAPGLAVAEKARSGGWSDLRSQMKRGAPLFAQVSYQEVIEAGLTHGADLELFTKLQDWVAGKIDEAARSRGHTATDDRQRTRESR